MSERARQYLAERKHNKEKTMSEKEQFEAWWIKRGAPSTFAGTQPAGGDWYYFWDEIQDVWTGWMARAQLAAPAPSERQPDNYMAKAIEELKERLRCGPNDEAGIGAYDVLAQLIEATQE
jgi:hypothetical protein